MGKGSFDFFQNHVNHWWLLYLANICMRWLWLLRMSTSFLLDIFWPLVHVEVSVPVSSFVPYWSSMLRYLPHLCGKQSVVSVLLGRIWVFQTTLLSRPILSSFHPPLLLRRKHSLSLEALWWVHGRIAATSSVCRLTCCCLSPIHPWYSSEIFQALRSWASQDPSTEIISLHSLMCESWLVTSRYTMR